MTFYKKVQNFITLMLVLLIVMSFSTIKLAYAEDGGIMSELATMKIDGKPFNVSDYPAVADGAPQVLNLYECGYSQSGEQERYGLLLYVYTPSQNNLKNDKRNAVQMITGNASGERSAKYNLKLLEVSADKLFAKFQVDFTERQKTYVLSTLDKDSRRYDVNTIELYVSGANATSYPIERAFTYTGFESTDSLSGTLSYTVEGGTATIPVKAKHTTWRPDGSKQGAGKYVQDSIHSIYFAIPNAHAEQYDYLKSVHVEWLEAMTAPIFVTGNAEIYEAVDYLVKSQKGKVVNDDELSGGGAVPSSMVAPEEFDFSGFDYALGGGLTKTSETIGGHSIYLSEMALNYLYSAGGNSNVSIVPTNILPALYWNILVEGNAGDYTLSSSEILSYVNSSGPFYNDKKVGGKYPSYLFESWADEKHEEVIPVGKEYKLTSEKIVQEYWYEKIFGTSHIANKEEFKACAIQEVRSITENSEVDCAAYYIGESDYPEFKEFYKANEATSTIYLLRFATSEYTQMQVKTIGETKKLGIPCKDFIDSNSYFAQSKVFLDFDLIDLEYVKEDESYVIPVNMSPIDIFPNVTPPVYWDEPVSDFWKYGCAMIGGLIVFYVVYRVAIKIRRGKQ